MQARIIGKSYRNPTGRVCIGQGRPHVQFESVLEKDYYILRSADPRICTIHPQPVTIRFEHEGQARRYTPDALLEFHAGPDGTVPRPQLEEVKYTDELRARADELAPVFAVARSYAEQRGWDFNVVSDNDIRGVALDNIMLLRRYRRVGNVLDLERAHELADRLRQCGPLTMSDLITGIPDDVPGETLRQAWIMLAHGLLTFDRAQPLTRASTVSLWADITPRDMARAALDHASD